MTDQDQDQGLDRDRDRGRDEGGGGSGGAEWGARGRRRGQGELEVQVLSALRAAPGPETAAWVRAYLGGTLAYTTVMTILTRLHAKRVVTRERVGRSFLWTAAADEAGLAAHRMRRVLDGETDREAVLMSFVSGLSARDEELLRALLNEARESDAHESDAHDDAHGGEPGGRDEDRDGREN
ncbi:BlaI/MecI/CopY family transcriptional regulator [Streptomyces sp. NPDC047987]|uniref:BlaI/MecI/CopY family transcriptional regulator n=1 Tax=unclassified Streptomyces TaxID=2593676 RepID=UPI00344AA336